MKNMSMTVQQIIDKLIEPVGKVENTVDTLKFGDPSMEVNGIAVAFMPTQQVIRQAVEMGANLLITHEGIFYSHHDQTDSLKNDPVCVQKRKFIEDSGIAIFRLHDYIHRYQPDGIMAGLISALDWDSFVVEHQPAASILEIPAAKADEIISYVKKMLGIDYIRATGDLSIACKRIGLLAGYRGGGNLAIPLLEKGDLDLIIYGEGPEWETPEYVRDAVFQGKQKALIVLGHAESEEPGMKHLAKSLETFFPGIPVHFIPGKKVFQIY